jgi:FkbM family methyltransferase
VRELRQPSYAFHLIPFVPDLIIDCGAHIGGFSLLATSHFPHCPLLAFEPDSTSYWFLCRQMRHHPTAECIHAAVGVADGLGWFQEGGHWGALLTNGASSATSRRVSVLDLKARIQEKSPRTLLLKMDIEGAETTVLPHILPVLPPQTFLFFETHGGTQVWQMLCHLLEEHGFSVHPTNRRVIEGIADQFVDAWAVRNTSFP